MKSLKKKKEVIFKGILYHTISYCTNNIGSDNPTTVSIFNSVDDRAARNNAVMGNCLSISP